VFRIFARRIRERFFSCIRALEKTDSRPDYIPISDNPDPNRRLPVEQCVTPGFAIMGLCCLLIDTLQSFQPQDRDWLKRIIESVRIRFGRGQTVKDFTEFLRRGFGNAFSDPKIAKKFAQGVRHGIFHRAETRRWNIRRNEPKDQILERVGSRYILNRSLFLRALRKEYASYLKDLRNPRNTELREEFLRRMNKIVSQC